MSSPRKPDPRIDRRHVIMTNIEADYTPDGKLLQRRREAHQWVRDADIDLGPEVGVVNYLDAFVAEARTRFQSVYVDRTQYDAGPGGYHAPSWILAHLRRGVTLQQHLHDIGELPLVDAHPVTGVDVLRPGFGAHKGKALETIHVPATKEGSK